MLCIFFSKSCFKVDETTVGATTLIIDVRATQRPILDFHSSRRLFRYGNHSCDKRSNDFSTPGIGTKQPGQQKAPPRPRFVAHHFGSCGMLGDQQLKWLKYNRVVVLDLPGILRIECAVLGECIVYDRSSCCAWTIVCDLILPLLLLASLQQKHKNFLVVSQLCRFI